MDLKDYPPNVIHLPDKSAKRKPARKKSSGSEQREKPKKMSFRVYEKEKAAIEAAAMREGLTPGSYMRARALSSPITKPRRKVTASVAMLSQLLGQVGKAGGNIQQINKRLNFNQPVQDYELTAALADWRTATAAIVAAIGVPKDDY